VIRFSKCRDLALAVGNHIVQRPVAPNSSARALASVSVNLLRKTRIDIVA
jgi:hypothetical protein